MCADEGEGSMSAVAEWHGAVGDYFVVDLKSER